MSRFFFFSNKNGLRKFLNWNMQKYDLTSSVLHLIISKPTMQHCVYWWKNVDHLCDATDQTVLKCSNTAEVHSCRFNHLHVNSDLLFKESVVNSLETELLVQLWPNVLTHPYSRAMTDYHGHSRYTRFQFSNKVVWKIQLNLCLMDIAFAIIVLHHRQLMYWAVSCSGSLSLFHCEL